MTKRRATRKALVYNGLGFPILLDAGHIETPYGTTLDVNHNQLQRCAFEALIRKPGRLSGAELRFIRHYMELTQKAFADLLGVDQSAVAKWEGKDLSATEMAQATEAMVRIQMARFSRQSLDSVFPFIEPAVRKRQTGKLLELSL